MNRMWVRLSVAFSLVMFVAIILPILGLLIFSSQTGISYQVALPKGPVEIPTDIPPLGIVGVSSGTIHLEALLLFLASASLVIGTTMGVWVSRSISKPAIRLVNAVQAISKQNLNYRIPAEGSQELVDLAHAVNQMAGDLENAEQVRRNMLADVTHELRTPLTILQGNLRAILDGVYSTDKEEIQSLLDQTEHLGHLINDLHILALAEAGQIPNAPQALDLCQQVRQVVNSLSAIVVGNEIQLIFEADKEDFWVEVDPSHVQQILHNLLSNAIKHTPSGGSITVTLQHNSTGILLTVSDTGHGIPPDELPFVFNRFYSRENTRRRDSGGSGLGLTITKKIVEKLDGSIMVWSEPGKGSTFTVHFPGLMMDPDRHAKLNPLDCQ